MKFFITSILLLLSPLLVICQSTYGKIIDLPKSPSELGVKILFHQDSLIVLSRINCESNNILSGCSGVSKFTLEGELVFTNTVNRYFPLMGSSAIVEEDSLFFLSFIETRVFDNIPITQLNLSNFDGETLGFSTDNNKQYFPQGIQTLNDTYLIHGHYDDLTPGVRIKGFVKRFNQDFTEELDSWTFGENEFLSINDLRVTPENNLVFSFSEQQVGSSGPEYPVKIIKIDTLGQTIDEFKVEDGTVEARNRMNLDIDVQGEVYFNFDERSRQRIVKLDKNLDSLLWNIYLPTDFHPKGRNYTVSELFVTSNGEIVVGGNVDYLHQNEGRVNGAFVARIDASNGEIKWLKILINELVVPAPYDEKYAQTFLYDIIELPNGNLSAVGEVAQRTFTDTVFHQIFLLSISEDGCIEGFDCEDDIYVLNAGESFPLFTSTSDLLEIEDEIIYPNPAQDKLYLETTDQNWTYQILNIQGQQMMQGEYQDYIGVEALPSGIYFLQLQQEGDLYQAIKFIKQ